MNREIAIKKHRKMWNWLAAHPGENKEDYIRLFESKDSYILNHCYLCHYIEGNDLSCKECPIDWGNNTTCISGRRLYTRWFRAMVQNHRALMSKLAKEIAGLPERRTDVKTGE